MKNIENGSMLEQKDELLQKVTDLRVLYKKEKLELEYADNTVDEGFIQDNMDSYAREIRKLNRILEDIREVIEES